MKEFTFCVPVSGYEYHIVHANDYDEAVQMIKDGDSHLTSSEVDYDGGFYVEDEVELDQEDLEDE